MYNTMLYVIRAGLLLVVTILIAKALLPEVADGGISIILKLIAIAERMLDITIDKLP